VKTRRKEKVKTLNEKRETMNAKRKIQTYKKGLCINNE